MARWQPAERNARYSRRRDAGFPVAVSEGDSWFDYPFYPNTIDLIDDVELFAHLRLETSGHTVAEMIGTDAALDNLATVVEEAGPLCVLFSGGGNDLADAARRLFCQGTGDDPAAYLDATASDDLFGFLEARYEAMIAVIGPMAPIFAHGYDYFAPSTEPVRFNLIDIGIGPWICPAMASAGIADDALRRAIAAVLVDRFNDMVHRLAEAHPLDFVHVDLRGTLDIDEDWENEIHPTPDGFVKVADAFVGQLQRDLPDRLRARLQPLVVARV